MGCGSPVNKLTALQENHGGAIKGKLLLTFMNPIAEMSREKELIIVLAFPNGP